MRRLLLHIVFVLICTDVWCQNDTVRSEAQPYDTATYYYYYDSAYHPQALVQAPNRNPIYYFDSPFCDHFLELKNLFSRGAFGWGLSYTYLPEVWGGNLSFVSGSDYLTKSSLTYLSAGCNYRLSRPWWTVDLQLVGDVGVLASNNFSWIRPTLEAGCRLSWGEGFGRFSLNSISLGVMTDFNGIYGTVGLSLILAPLSIILFAIPY